MALAHEPDVSGFAYAAEPLLVPRWSESSTFQSAPAARSIYDMPIRPLASAAIAPAAGVDAIDRYVAHQLRAKQAQARHQSASMALVLPFPESASYAATNRRFDSRPLWVGAAFIAAVLCALVTVASSWFTVEPAAATSSVQRVASQLTTMLTVTGVATLAAVVSTALLLVGTQRSAR